MQQRLLLSRRLANGRSPIATAWVVVGNVRIVDWPQMNAIDLRSRIRRQTKAPPGWVVLHIEDVLEFVKLRNRLTTSNHIAHHFNVSNGRSTATLRYLHRKGLLKRVSRGFYSA